MLERVEAEIIGLHEFFVAWFTGQRSDFDRVETALHADFSMVTPDGQQLDRAAILARLAKAPGSIAEAFEIGIEAVRQVWRSADALLVSYVEAQRRGETRTRRRSTALFVTDGALPDKLVWRHLHETWM
jgi:hypothetical protein